jgi:hypothetical protein
MPSLLIRQDLVPIVVGYLVIMGTLALGLRILRRSPAEAGAADLRGPSAAPEPASASAPEPSAEAVTAGRARRGASALIRPGPGWPRLIIHLGVTATGGYLLLMAVVLLYYYGVARVGGRFLESAFSGCALLVGLSTPVFLAASWLAERRDQRANAGKAAK